MKTFLKWFDVTSRPFGWLVLSTFMITAIPLGMLKTAATISCTVANYQCTKAWSANSTNVMTGLVGELLDDNPKFDIQMIPKNPPKVPAKG